jgi:hypothetical protein
MLEHYEYVFASENRVGGPNAVVFGLAVERVRHALSLLEVAAAKVSSCPALDSSSEQ